MKKALIVGINEYPAGNELSGCINDASAVAQSLCRNADSSPNFDILKRENIPTKSELMVDLRNLFNGDGDVALFYFSGHGLLCGNTGYIVTPDFSPGAEGVSMCEIIQLANESKYKSRVIILDCCHSGQLCTTSPANTGAPHIAQGVTILSACNYDEGAVERHGHGLFTSLMIDALNGGAASVDGEVSPSGIYSYIDRSLGAWEQRPLFATNVSERVVLRKAKPMVPLSVLRNICDYFVTADSEHTLDPSYEETNSPTVDHEVREPYAKKENVTIFKDLQKLERCGLVMPVNEEHMYFAAINSKSCVLTARGKHYWHLVKKNRI